MSSIRLRIADAVADVIATATGLVVFRNLDRALEAERAPAVNVESGPDNSQAQPAGIQESTVDIIVSILVSQSSSPEAAADPYEVQIHDALFADRRLGGLATLLQRLGGQWAFDLGDSVSRQITYRYTYRTPINALETVA